MGAGWARRRAPMTPSLFPWLRDLPWSFGIGPCLVPALRRGGQADKVGPVVPMTKRDNRGQAGQAGQEPASRRGAGKAYGRRGRLSRGPRTCGVGTSARAEGIAEPGQGIGEQMICGSDEWDAERKRAVDAANARRSEATKAQHAVSNPRAGESKSGRASHEAPPNLTPAAPVRRDSAAKEAQKATTRLASEVGVSRATMERATAGRVVAA